jgi:hypothetical protein
MSQPLRKVLDHFNNQNTDLPPAYLSGQKGSAMAGAALQVARGSS